MGRKIYISDKRVSLAEFVVELDNANSYNCWQDEATQNGFNYKRRESLKTYCSHPRRSRFYAVILRNTDQVVLGEIFVSPEGSPPDLAIMLYAGYRHSGYGTAAFALGVKYCFEVLNLNEIFAGCYETNAVSRKMLVKCGFIPHPEGNLTETHYLTGAKITQFDFVKHRE